MIILQPMLPILQMVQYKEEATVLVLSTAAFHGSWDCNQHNWCIRSSDL